MLGVVGCLGHLVTKFRTLSSITNHVPVFQNTFQSSRPLSSLPEHFPVFQSTLQSSRTLSSLPEHFPVFQNTFQSTRTLSSLPEHFPVFQDTFQSYRTLSSLPEHFPVFQNTFQSSRQILRTFAQCICFWCNYEASELWRNGFRRLHMTWQLDGSAWNRAAELMEWLPESKFKFRSPKILSEAWKSSSKFWDGFPKPEYTVTDPSYKSGEQVGRSFLR